MKELYYTIRTWFHQMENSFNNSFEQILLEDVFTDRTVYYQTREAPPAHPAEAQG